LQTIPFFVVGLLLLQTNAFGMPEPKDSIIFEPAPVVTKHDPAKATIFAAVLPGLGQVYNKKYWKVPFVWGGFIGLGYFVVQYNKRYVNFKKAYYDLNDNNPNTKFYETIAPEYDYTNTGNYSQYNQNFIQQIDGYRRQRDLYIIYTAGFYLLSILDANVDAHFIDFDISEDLTVNIEPILIDPITTTPFLGGQITFTF
jgi:hypothetical protein